MFYWFLAAFLVVALLIGVTRQGRKAARIFAGKNDGEPYNQTRIE